MKEKKEETFEIYAVCGKSNLWLNSTTRRRVLCGKEEGSQTGLQLLTNSFLVAPSCYRLRLSSSFARWCWFKFWEFCYNSGIRSGRIRLDGIYHQRRGSGLIKCRFYFAWELQLVTTAYKKGKFSGYGKRAFLSLRGTDYNNKYKLTFTILSLFKWGKEI